MTKHLLILIQLLVLLTFGTQGFALNDSRAKELPLEPAKFIPLMPDREQREASIHIARSLLLSHYSKQEIDKSLSEKVFDNYLNSLDGQRLYFLKSDMDEFEIYRYRLHSALKTGQLEPGFRIYNRYTERVIERLNGQLALLKNDFDKINFNDDEYILANRKDAKWAESKAELDDLWRRRVKSAVLSITLSGKPLAEAKDILTKRYQNQLNRNLQVRNEDAFQAYMNAFTTVYDPHTNYFSPQSSENFNINMSLSLEGIGAVLQSDNEYTKVVRLIPGGPAQKQGQLKAADRIVGVAQGLEGEMVNVVGWRLDEVVELIRGPKSSLVRLEVISSEASLDTETREIHISREQVKLEEQAASSSVLEVDRGQSKHRVGVIEIPTFYADFQAMQQGDNNYKSTTRDVLKLLQELQKDQPIDGLVIDLRGNGGGSLDEANQLTGLFIHQGPTVQIRNANNHVEVMEDPDPELVYGGPLVILVDRLSASASEIFAGAIQDYGRGVVMGSNTFGKGTVQSVRPLNHGQLKITQAKFYRISGGSTQHKGVVPDIYIPSTIDPTKVGEDALDHALQWDSIDSAQYAHLNHIGSVTEQLNLRHNQRFEANPEYKILLEEISLLEQQRAKETVSLNQKKREIENAELDKAQLEIINKRRSLNNLPPVKNITEWEALEEQKASEVKTGNVPDFVVKEGAEVLLDMIDLQRQLTAKAA